MTGYHWAAIHFTWNRHESLVLFIFVLVWSPSKDSLLWGLSIPAPRMIRWGKMETPAPKSKGYDILVGPPWFSHQNNHVSGWLVDKCEREHRKSFLPKANERPISSVSWQPWATVGSYWILSELHQGIQEERVMVKSSLEERWNRLSLWFLPWFRAIFPGMD